jgi:hypothetical protein
MYETTMALEGRTEVVARSACRRALLDGQRRSGGQSRAIWISTEEPRSVGSV